MRAKCLVHQMNTGYLSKVCTKNCYALAKGDLRAGALSRTHFLN